MNRLPLSIKKPKSITMTRKLSLEAKRNPTIYTNMLHGNGVKAPKLI